MASSGTRRVLPSPSSAPPPTSSSASSSASSNDGILARIGSSIRQSDVVPKSKRAASNTARFSRKLLWSTGKAAWIAGTTFLVLVVPLIIEMDREAQLSELEGHQASLLGAPSQPPGLAAVK